MNRITIAMLEYKVETINKLLNAPLKPYTRTPERAIANIGNYHLYQAYGAVGLHKMTNEGGGIREIIGLGTKRETYDKLCAFIRGIESK